MKTIHYLIFTLIALIILAFVPNSFAQDNSPEYVVRVIYFLPNDRDPQPDIDESLDMKIKESQLYFANQLAAHGFEKKTFTAETDEHGKAVVHHVIGQHGDLSYQTGSGTSNVAAEISQKFDMSKNIYYIVLDISSGYLNGGGAIGTGSGNGINGVVFVTAKALFLDKDVLEVPHLSVHELGHAFGLLHDIRSSYWDRAKRIHTVEHFFDPMTSTFCAAEWFDGSRYFNSVKNGFNTDTVFQLHPIEAVSFPNKVRFPVTVTDPDGIHQVQMFKWASIDGKNEMLLISCQKLSGTYVDTEFVTDDLIFDYYSKAESNTEVTFTNRIMFKALDAYGNITTSRHFDIPINDILSLDKQVPIPDKNLAAVIRESLGLLPGDSITYRNIMSLTDLNAVDRNIESVEGIENAIRLWRLNLLYNQIKDIEPISRLPNLVVLNVTGNQISDITSLKDLKGLRKLSIAKNLIEDISVLPLMNLDKYLNTRDSSLSIGDNPISDITPLWKLTDLYALLIRDQGISDISPIAKFKRLQLLQVDGNNISDLTPLSNITTLHTLILWRNKITDTKPLVNLTNLKKLELQGNPITNKKPLIELLQKNPDVQIYLNWDRKPLPVNLSHFRAEHTDAGVILKWTTESEVDNAGFYIYRSETRDGEFKVVNPSIIQGAGTTGQRSEYTWTDTTAKPNTVYYYRIEDVSHAGVRKSLATVRLRGLVSPKGKLTTSWSELKR